MTTFVQQAFNGVAVGAIYGFVAVGYSLIFGVLKVFNIAHGDVAILAAYVGLVVVGAGIGNVWVVALIVLASGALLGALVDRVCIRPVSRGPWSAPLLTTLGAAMVLAGAMRMIFGPDVRPFPLEVTTGTMEILGISVGRIYVIVAFSAVALTLIMEFVLARTAVGRWLRAVSESPADAATVGIPVAGVRLGTVMVSSALGAAAGLLLAVLLGGLAPAMGLTLAIKGVIVLIVGGMASPRGAMVVGVALGTTEALTAAYVSSSLRDLVAYAFLLVVLVIRPAGVFGNAKALVGVRP